MNNASGKGEQRRRWDIRSGGGKRSESNASGKGEQEGCGLVRSCGGKRSEKRVGERVGWRDEVEED